MPDRSAAQDPALLDLIATLSPEQLALLQEALAEDGGEPATVPDHVAPRAPRAGEPLSFAQERLWFLDRMAPGLAAYNLAGEFRVRVPDPAALERAVSEVVRRHEALRTTFHEREGGPVQVVAPAAPVEIPVHDLSALPPAERQAEAARRAGEEARLPFDLERGPLLRLRLLRLEGDEHVLLVAMHHIVADGWSLALFFRELDVLTAAFARGEPSPLPEPPLQYPDFARWQRERPAEEWEAALRYWRERLAGAPERLDLPADFPRPAVQRFRGGLALFRLGPQVAERVHALARAEGASPFMVLLAAYGLLLARYAGTDDVLVGSPAAGRSRSELEGVIGFFVNILVLRVETGGRPAFRELLRRVKETTLEAYARDLPLERLVEALHPERTPAYNPLFQALFVLQNTPEGMPATPLAGVEEAAGAYASPQGTAKFDVTLFLSGGEEGFAGGIEYDTDLFAPATAVRLADAFRALLGAAVAEPDRPAAELPLLTPEARAAALEVSRGPAADPAAASVPERIADRARAAPGAPAVVWEGGTLPYGELEARANRLARRLRALGVGPESRVGVCLERSPELVVALLAVLRAGGAYLPLDPGNPPERLAAVADDARPEVVLTRRALAERVPASGAPCLFVEGAWLEGADPGPPDAGRPPSCHQAAYVVYTSGSTGRPKGVVVPHGALAALVAWQLDALALGPEDAVALASPVGFDPLAMEVWPTLAAGGALHPLPAESRGDPARLAAWLAAHEITAAFFTPVSVEPLLAAPGGAGRLRILGTGGEALRARPAPGLPFVLLNLYGPTEFTVNATAAAVAPEGAEPGPPPIGVPIAGAAAYLLDEAMEPVPWGAAGELYLGGASLARGYVGMAGETALRFVPDPFSRVPGARLYRTGDRARRRPDGALVFLGRTDDQVKVRGVRVEPGEVEAALRAHPGIGEAAVALAPGPDGRAALAAWVVGAEGREPPAPAELRRFLRERLPEAMVPTAWMALGALPRTAHGKVDRRRLPSPSAAAPAAVRREPRTPEEREVAAIVAEVLGTGPLGMEDDFFDLGGHSLLATQVLSRVRARLGVDLPLHLLFSASTIEALAQEVAARRPRSAPPPDPAAPATAPAPPPPPAPALDGAAGEEARVRAEVAALSDDAVAARLAALLGEPVPPPPPPAAVAQMDDDQVYAALERLLRAPGNGQSGSSP